MTAGLATERFEAICRVAGTQRGLVSAAQLEAAGMGRSARNHAVDSARLIRHRRGVFRLAGVPTTWETDVLAAILGHHGSAVVASHATAARLWRMVTPESPCWSDAIELSCAEPIRLEGTTGHRAELGPWERSERRSVPVTSPVRTLFDLAGRVGEDVSGLMLDEALRLRLAPLGALRHALEDRRSRSGVKTAADKVIDKLLAERGEHFDPGANEWERRMDTMWEEWGLPHAERQYWIRTPNGNYRPDRAIVPLRIAVDWNGYEYHGQRSRFDRDSYRRSHLIQAGWCPLDFTSRCSPAHVCRTVLSAVAQRSAQLGRPVPASSSSARLPDAS